jgi:hypothetical protein
VIHNPEKFAQMRCGVVMKRSPGATRWAKWSWKATAVLPGAADAKWKPLQDAGDHREFHVSTPMLELHGAETDAYVHGLQAQVPCVYVVLRATDDDAQPFEVVLATVSPYEAQDYADSGEEIVEKIAMPAAVRAFVEDFVDQHHIEQEFKKRRRDRKDVHLHEDGIGDARVAQLADVYRTPASMRKERLQ